MEGRETQAIFETLDQLEETCFDMGEMLWGDGLSCTSLQGTLMVNICCFKVQLSLEVGSSSSVLGIPLGMDVGWQEPKT